MTDGKEEGSWWARVRRRAPASRWQERLSAKISEEVMPRDAGEKNLWSSVAEPAVGHRKNRRQQRRGLDTYDDNDDNNSANLFFKKSLKGT
jgi:hypothetical protein